MTDDKHNIFEAAGVSARQAAIASARFAEVAELAVEQNPNFGQSRRERVASFFRRLRDRIEQAK